MRTDRESISGRVVAEVARPRDDWDRPKTRKKVHVIIQVPIDIHNIIAITTGGVGVLGAAVFWFLPRLTRPDLYFAVTVPRPFRDGPEGKSILRRYRIELIVV